MLRYSLLVAIAIVLYACAGPRPPLERTLPGAFPNHTALEIRYELLAPHETLDAFTARSSVVIRDADGGRSFSAEMHERRDDSLFVSISPGLGIEAARALVTSDSFFFYDRIKNRVLYGSLSEASGLLPEPFTSDDLFANLLGLPVPAPNVEWDIQADDNYYHLTDPAEKTLYVVDPALWRVVRYEERDDAGALLDRRIFSEFDEFDGVVLPRRLVFERPQDDREASIYYRSMSLNPSRLRFELDVRDSADHIAVGGEEG